MQCYGKDISHSTPTTAGQHTLHAASIPPTLSYSPKCPLTDLCKFFIFDYIVAEGKFEVVMVRHLTHGPAAPLSLPGVNSWLASDSFPPIDGFPKCQCENNIMMNSIAKSY